MTFSHTCTLPNDATPQQVYDYVVAHLRKQWPNRAWENGFCQYRTSDGLMCAVGCLISDDIDTTEFIGSVSSLIRHFPELPSYIPNNCELLTRLQMVHDEEIVFSDKKRLEADLNSIASLFGLDYTPPEPSID